MTKNREGVRERITAVLEAHPYRYYKAKELAKLLRVSPREYRRFRSILRDLAESGVVNRVKKNRYSAPQPSQTATGKLSVKSGGYGFMLTPEGEEDVYVSGRNMGIALDGDQVKVQLFARADNKKPEGRVVEVLERGRQYIVGTLRQGKHYHFLVPDDARITRDVYVHENDLGDAEPGQKVAVVIEDWEDELLNPEGRVSHVLGFPDEPGVDIYSIIAGYNLPLEFPEEVEREAAFIPSEPGKADFRDRLDLRDTVCFTIDPPDAKDFDDAVSYRPLANGNMEIGVHIADVSHFVPEGGTIDEEALDRATSVYLVDRVVPMLPEKLSNEVCSLRPNTDRLTFSCLIELTPSGERKSYRIVETVIHSDRRFTYDEVQSFFDGKLELDEKLAEPLRQLRKLARTLRKRRADAGALEFETPEAKVILDDDGYPIEIQRRETLESMQLIEEYMLLANKTVAEHVESFATDGDPPPFIYRIHESPTREKMTAFSEFVHALGYGFQVGKRITSKKLSTLIREIRGTDEERIIESVMLRSLMKAKYDVVNAGHFGLAFSHYTHFTSPIRRYPDLVVHRMLKWLANEGWKENLRGAMRKKLEAICAHVSERESQAQEAERASVKMKQVQYMTDKLGEEYDGVVTGVVEFGIFVEISSLLVEGLVHISDLRDDFYSFSKALYTLEGTTTGEKFRIGDAVRICVVRVDPDERVIDFTLVKRLKSKRIVKSPPSKRERKPKPAEKEKKVRNADGKKKSARGRKKQQRSKAGKRKSTESKGKTEVKAKDSTKEKQPITERVVSRRQLTRADDDRTVLTTMRQPAKPKRGGRGRASSGHPSKAGGRPSNGSRAGGRKNNNPKQRGGSRNNRGR